MADNLAFRVRGPVYFGQPWSGFFFARDFLTASLQLPSILSTSGFGPGVALPWRIVPLLFFLRLFMGLANIVLLSLDKPIESL